MATLTPPTPSRSRASSTTLRPALTLKTLGRRRSCSQLQPSIPSSPQCTTPSADSRPSMFLMALSSVLQWLHLEPKHVLLPEWSSPSTPESTDDIYTLPLPASATKASFTDVLPPKSSQRNPWPSVSQAIDFSVSISTISDACTNSARCMPIPSINSSRAPFSIKFTNTVSMAENSDRPCSVGQGASTVL